MIICEEVMVAANEGELIDQGRMPSICVEVEGILGQGTKGGDRRVTRVEVVAGNPPRFHVTHLSRRLKENGEPNRISKAITYQRLEVFWPSYVELTFQSSPSGVRLLYIPM